MRNNRITVLVECALAVALAVVLNLIAVRLPINIAGGSVSLTMLPIIILALRRGPAAGAVTGLLFGMLDFLMEPFIVHWAQVIFDYPLPYLLLGLGVGLFSRAYAQVSEGTAGSVWGKGSIFIIVAVIVGGILRYLTHVLSGVIFFAEYAEGGNVWAYSLIYNITYLAPSLVSSLVLALILLPILSRAVPVRDSAQAQKSNSI